MEDQVASHLAAACSRSALHQEAFPPLREAFPHSKLLMWVFVCDVTNRHGPAEYGRQLVRRPHSVAPL